jgi:hypothetical protein
MLGKEVCSQQQVYIDLMVDCEVQQVKKSYMIFITIFLACHSGEGHISN